MAHDFGEIGWSQADDWHEILYEHYLMPHVFKTHRFNRSRNKPWKQEPNLRVYQEIQKLKKELPVSWDNSIFVVQDEYDPHYFQVAITGVANTPYDSGILFFEMILPRHYPKTAPVVKLLHVHEKINPSIFISGQVALSLLDNYGDNATERWNPKTGSLYQVLVSIQSLVLNQEPYFMHPGKEKYFGTARGTKESTAYNEACYSKVIKYLMTKPLRKPPPGFEEVVDLHFGIKKKYVVFLAHAWELLADDCDNVAKIKEERTDLEEAYHSKETDTSEDDQTPKTEEELRKEQECMGLFETSDGEDADDEDTLLVNYQRPTVRRTRKKYKPNYPKMNLGSSSYEEIPMPDLDFNLGPFGSWF